MGRPKGSVNKFKEGMPVVSFVPQNGPTVAVVDPLPSTTSLPDRKQFTESIHYDEILGVRVLRKGQFKGLWELVRLDDTGKVKQVVTDANSRGMVINLATKSILRIVAAM